MSFSQEKQQLLHTQLVKYGVNYSKAAIAAEILVSGKPDELLTDEEIQLTLEVCREWLKQRKRLDRLQKTINL